MFLERYGAVRVLTGLPNYGTNTIPKEYKCFRKRKETIENVEICRTSIIARRQGVFFRALNYISFCINASVKALFCSKKQIEDIFVFQTSPVFQAVPGIVLKKQTGKRLILYCQDLWPESLKAWNVKEDSWLYKIVAHMSRWIYQACDIILITSLPFKDYLIEHCDIKENRIFYLPQHEEDLYSDIVGIYEENNCIDFLFAGNIGAVQDLSVVLQAVKQLGEAPIPYKVHLVGDGTELTTLQELSKELGIEDKIVFHGRHPLSEMKRFYKMADCFLLTLSGESFIGKTLPGKIQGYLSAGKPILGVIDGAGHDLILEADCGEAVPAGSVEECAKAMERIILNFPEYRIKGNNGRKYYETHFTKEVFKENLFSILDRKEEQ